MSTFMTDGFAVGDKAFLRANPKAVPVTVTATGDDYFLCRIPGKSGEHKRKKAQWYSESNLWCDFGNSYVIRNRRAKGGRFPLRWEAYRRPAPGHASLVSAFSTEDKAIEWVDSNTVSDIRMLVGKYEDTR